MELRYPFIIIVVFIGLIINFFINKKGINQFKNGSKIANTSYIKNNDFYKKLVNKYKIILTIIKISCYISIIVSTILLSRLAIIDTTSKTKYNRDIFLCMDVSGSVDKLNSEVVDNLKKTVNYLKGERIGISIFNTSSVTLVPLTEDYDFVLNVLDTIKSSIELNNSPNIDLNYDNYFYMRNYIISGTLEGNELRGASLIGDGLASCTYNFSDDDKERTKIIIFTTDNDLAGTPIVSLSKAAEISKKHNVKVFGIATKNISEKNKQEFKNAVLSTNGKFYESSKFEMNNIIDDIESTSKSLLRNNFETKKTDIPKIPFIILILSSFVLVIVNRKVVK